MYWELFTTTLISYTYGTIVKIYIVHELGTSSSHSHDLTLKSCLFGAVTFTTNADINNTGTLVMELDLIENQAFIFVWWIW